MKTRSRKPSVVTKAVLAPLRSSSALVATVDPCTTSARRPPLARSMPSKITAAGAAGFDRSLKLSSLPPSCRTTKSVNVPPVSTPMRTDLFLSGRKVTYLLVGQDFILLDDYQLVCLEHMLYFEIT